MNLYHNICAGALTVAILWAAFSWGLKELNLAKLHEERLALEQSARAGSSLAISVLKAERGVE